MDNEVKQKVMKMCVAVWDSVDSTSVVVSQYGQ